MTPSRVSAPEPVELVSTDEMRALIEDTDRQFRVLEMRAADATAAADYAEERARSFGMDSHTPAAMAALQRFLGDWRSRADDDARRMLDAARHGARVRVEQAHAEAERVRRARHSEPVVAPRVAPAAAPLEQLEPSKPVEVPQSAEPATPVSIWAPQPVVAQPGTVAIESLLAAPAVVPVPVVDATVAPVAAPEPVVDAPTTPLPAPAPVVEVPAAPVVAPEPVVEAPVTTLAAPEPVLDDDIFAAPHQVADLPATSAELNQPEPNQLEPNQADFWPAQPAPARKGVLRRIPISAVLEVVAVLLILVFILLRLS